MASVRGPSRQGMTTRLRCAVRSTPSWRRLGFGEHGRSRHQVTRRLRDHRRRHAGRRLGRGPRRLIGARRATSARLRVGRHVTIKAYLQTSLDQGVTAIDIACFTFGMASAVKARNLSALTPKTIDVIPTDGASPTTRPWTACSAIASASRWCRPVSMPARPYCPDGSTRDDGRRTGDRRSR